MVRAAGSSLQGTLCFMRVLITGINGTLAPKVAAEALGRGWQVVPWDRSAHRFAQFELARGCRPR